jgi:hypothetical protein
VHCLSARINSFLCHLVRLQLASEVDILQQLHHDSLVSYLFMVNEGTRFSVVRVGCGGY